MSYTYLQRARHQQNSPSSIIDHQRSKAPYPWEGHSLYKTIWRCWAQKCHFNYINSGQDLYFNPEKGVFLTQFTPGTFVFSKKVYVFWCFTVQRSNFHGFTQGKGLLLRVLSLGKVCFSHLYSRENVRFSGKFTPATERVRVFG